jgi:hypothetical protein
MTLLETILIGILLSTFINALWRTVLLKEKLGDVLLSFFLHLIPFLPVIIHLFIIRDVKVRVELSDEEVVEILEELEKKRNRKANDK